MSGGNVFVKVFNFYYEGLRGMTVGKTLWMLILIKLFIMFAILKVFFFRSHFAGMDKEQRSIYVIEELTGRSAE